MGRFKCWFELRGPSQDAVEVRIRGRSQCLCKQAFMSRPAQPSHSPPVSLEGLDISVLSTFSLSAKANQQTTDAFEKI